MTEDQFKKLQVTIRLAKNRSANRSFTRNYLGWVKVILEGEFMVLSERYETAKSIRMGIVFWETKVKEWTRIYHNVGFLKKDWAEGNLKKVIEKLREEKKKFEEL